MTCVFKLTSPSGKDVVAYDPKPLIEHYDSLGLEFESLNEVNYFTYGSLPEGSHGKLLVEAKAIRDIAEVHLVTLTIEGSEDTFIYKYLRIESIEYIATPLTDWSLTSSVDVHKRLAVVSVRDIFTYDRDHVIRKDYNRITKLLPLDKNNVVEPTQDNLLSFEAILKDIWSYATVDVVGAPDIKPHNVLSAGCSSVEMSSYIADSLLLNCYASKDFISLIFTNESSSSELLERQPIFTKYGSNTFHDRFYIHLSQNADKLSKLRTVVLRDYYDKWGSNWDDEKSSRFLPEDDEVLENNKRFKNPHTSYIHYYPFYESVLGTNDGENTELSNLAGTLASNYAKRTQRIQKILYKDVANIDPSATVQKVTYKILDNIGLVTQVEGTEIRSTAVPPSTSQSARGFEYVPPMLVGINSPAGSTSIGGIAPGEMGLISLPDHSDAAESSTSTEVPYYNATNQQTFDYDTIAVYHNANTRRYEFSTPIEAIFRYTLRTDWTNGVAVAYRKHIATGVSSGVTVSVLDPLRIFDYQSYGDSGYMIHTKDDKFIAIQAPCNADVPPDSSTPVGACCVGSYCFDGLTESGCSSVGGAWKGEGVNCSSNPCSE